MVVWDLTRKIGLVLIIVAVIAAIGATIIGIATGCTGTWIGPLTGVFILVTFGVVALPLWLQSRSKMRHFQRIVANGPRITAVVETVYEEYVDPEASSDSHRYWSVGARGPKLDDGDQFYNQMIAKTKPNLRKGDEITIALDPTDPDKYACSSPKWPSTSPTRGPPATAPCGTTTTPNSAARSTRTRRPFGIVTAEAQARTSSNRRRPGARRR